MRVVEAPALVEAPAPRGRSALAPVPHLTVAERVARGRAARGEVPRSSHAAWSASELRPDPVALLEQQDASRVPELVPIRYGRMAASPFAFYRGAALVMASDLAGTPTSGLHAQICGDAHLLNFGGFASPDRSLVFDINDFDETLPGPWEWDVKRLAASIAVAGRAQSFTARERRTAITAAVREYRQAMAAFADMKNVDVWSSRLDAAGVTSRFARNLGRRTVRQLDRTMASAQSRDSTRAMARLAHTVEGEVRIISDPPLIVAVDEMLPDVEAKDLEKMVVAMVRVYRRSLPVDRGHLLGSYRYVHLARKVVGVGSVGLRAWVALFLGRDEADPLFLQFKEAQESVVERFVGGSTFTNSGRRVVEGQRLLQAASDVFLGWCRVQGIDGRTRDFYGRQLWDWKIAARVDTMQPAGMAAYARMCGWTLARGHARSGDRIAIAAYLGRSDVFDRAVATFAELYADQSEKDHQALSEAVRTGRVKATAEA